MARDRPELAVGTIVHKNMSVEMASNQQTKGRMLEDSWRSFENNLTFFTIITFILQ